ncbi:MAG TPA: hypothetical protein VLE95_08345 [Chlamydiales bacterium]|nr:hypothetical protein [Chlamydiales bacterium]
MIQKGFLVLLALIVSVSGFSQESGNRQRPTRRGEHAGYGSRDATVLSMMGWGLGLGAAIATLCALIPNNSGSTSH